MKADICNITLVEQFIRVSLRHSVDGIKNLCFLTQFIHSCRIFLFCETYCFSSREGNGTPLQCSCLENPMDGGAW